MDAVSLDGIVSEAHALAAGRHVRRVRPVGSDMLVLDAGRDARLVLSARRGSAGLFLCDPALWDRLPASPEAGGRAGHFQLRARASLQGARLAGLDRIPGERTVIVRFRAAVLALRLSGPAPAVSLAIDGRLAGTLGDGPPAWPVPEPRPDVEWHHLTPAAFALAVESLRQQGRSLRRACLAACPGLGPRLARELDGSAAGFAEMRGRLERPAPTLVSPGPLEACSDADLAPVDSVLLAPFAMGEGEIGVHDSWLSASSAFVAARWRGDAFARRRERGLKSIRDRRARLERLERALDRDAAGLPDAARSRRLATALLAHAHAVAPGAGRADVPDPEVDGARLSIPLDPAASAVENAEALFRRARRADRAWVHLERRRAETSAALDEIRGLEGAIEAAGYLRELDGLVAPEATASAAPRRDAGPPRFLTSRGLTLLVGRGARENHRVTFEFARPEDHWLHARDRRGAHVVLRDPEGRASASDLREAAEVAAHFSEARSEPAVDVHVTRRKHLRPVRGAPGRVVIGYSETLRVAPRDPEGRLRRLSSRA